MVGVNVLVDLNLAVQYCTGIAICIIIMCKLEILVDFNLAVARQTTKFNSLPNFQLYGNYLNVWHFYGQNTAIN